MGLPKGYEALAGYNWLTQERFKAAMKLSSKQNKVLAAIEHQADQPISVIRRQLRMQDHSVRYAIQTLTEAGIIVGRAPFIDLYPLDLTDYTLYFSLSVESQKVHKAFLKKVLASDRVSWVARLGGDYQYGVAFFARYPEQAFEFFTALSDEFDSILFNKSLIIKVKFWAFGRKYLAPQLKSLPELSFGHRLPDVRIDDTDRLILSTMSSQNYESNRDLARALDMPFSTLERRVKALREKGILKGEIYRLNLSSLGYQTYRLLIYASNLSAELSETLYHYCKSKPEILHLFEYMGDWDFEIGVELKLAEDITKIIDELYQVFPNSIRHIRLMQLFRHLKYTSYPFHHG